MSTRTRLKKDQQVSWEDVADVAWDRTSTVAFILSRKQKCAGFLGNNGNVAVAVEDVRLELNSSSPVRGTAADSDPGRPWPQT